MNPATLPMTMPAICPPLKLDDDDAVPLVGRNVGEFVGAALGSLTLLAGLTVGVLVIVFG